MNGNEGFWETLHLLIEYKRTGKDAKDEVDDWVNKVIARKKCLNEILEDENISVGTNGSFRTELSRQEEINKFHKSLNLPSITCKFKYPSGKSRVEQLMGSNMVSLTDRNYMQKLQHRIIEDYAHNMRKRVLTRQAEELERVKNLVLVGKIPLENAPPEMADHPVMLIENYCRPKRFTNKTRISHNAAPHITAKSNLHSIPLVPVLSNQEYVKSLINTVHNGTEKGKTKKLRLTSCSYSIETPTVGVENTNFIEKIDMLNQVENNFEEHIENDPEPLFEYESADPVKYEDPLIKELKECETVEEMYALADEIIGSLRVLNIKQDELSESSGKV